MEANSDSVDLSALQDQRDQVGSSGGSAPLEANFAKEVEADESLVDETGYCVRPGSLMRNTEQESEKTALRRLDRSRPLSTIDAAPARPLPKALQPKESRRGSQPLSPTSVYTSGTGYGQLSTGVNVSDSILRQQRRRSSCEFNTSPTAVSPNTGLSPTHLSAKPEVVLRRPETEMGSSFGGRRVVYEPNPGLATLRATQLRHVIRETTRQPEMETSPLIRHKSKSVADLLAIFQSPSSTTPRLKSPSYTPSLSIFSKFNQNKFEFEESPNIVTAVPTVDSASVSSAVFDPSPTISKMLRSQRSVDVRRGQKRLETQASYPETISVTPRPVLQIQKPVASPTAKEENMSDISTSSTTSGSIDLAQNSVSDGSNTDVEFPAGGQNLSDVDYEWLNLAAGKVQAATATVEESVNKAADADDEDVDDKAEAASGSGDVLYSNDAHAPPPLPSSPPPPVCAPRDIEEPDDDQLDRAAVAHAFHRPTDSNITDDSGLDCATPHDDDSADELDCHQQHHDVQRPVTWQSPRSTALCSTDSRSVTPASVNTDSELDDSTVEQNLLRADDAVEDDEFISGSTEMASLSSGNVPDDNDRNNDDVIRSCVADNSDAAVCEVRVIKGALGLGFCIEGGRGSLAGDRPITVKRLFQGDASLLGGLRVGDEIMSVNGEDFSEMSHFDAWNRLKAMPSGALRITVKRS